MEKGKKKDPRGRREREPRKAIEWEIERERPKKRRRGQRRKGNIENREGGGIWRTEKEKRYREQRRTRDRESREESAQMIIGEYTDDKEKEKRKEKV